MAKIKKIPEHPFSITITEFWDDRFFKSRADSICINHPSLSDSLIEWVSEHKLDVSRTFLYKNVRTHNGYGNKGGWSSRAHTCILIFEDSASEIMFRMKYNIFK